MKSNTNADVVVFIYFFMYMIALWSQGQTHSVLILFTIMHALSVHLLTFSEVPASQGVKGHNHFHKLYFVYHALIHE